MNGEWFLMEDAGKFNGKDFSFFANVGDITIQYDILEMNYKLSCRLYYFADYWRRRESERISLMYANVSVNVPSDEMHNIPLFKQELSEAQNSGKENEKVEKILVGYIDKDEDVKKALILKYASELGKKVYSDDEVKVCTLKDRCCGVDDIVSGDKDIVEKEIPGYIQLVKNFGKKIEKCVIQ